MLIVDRTAARNFDPMSGSKAVRSSATPLRLARKVAVAILGGSVLAVGVAMIVLPGPAFVVIPVGVALLATEFMWARRLLRRLKQGKDRILRRSDGKDSPSQPKRA
jgi:tellurite resistance protein TerC